MKCDPFSNVNYIYYRNCPNYDLCEYCEPSSGFVHPSNHVFLKIKIPVNVIYTSDPLLPELLYKQKHALRVTMDTTKDADRVRVKHEKKDNRPHHRGHSHHSKSGGYVTRSRDQLREEIKDRRKQEKKKVKLEEKLSMLTDKMAKCSVDGGGEAEKVEPKKGHGK